MVRNGCGILFLTLTLALQAEGDSGTWQRLPNGVLRQGIPNPEQSVFRVGKIGAATAWRCMLVPDYRDGAAGMRLGDLSLALEARDECTTLTLRMLPSRKIVWSDEFVNWQIYEPLWIELVRRESMVYVQAVSAAKTVLLAQSAWLEHKLANDSDVFLFTAGMTAEFYHFQAAPKALWQPDPNSPSKLRLPRSGPSDWVVVGGGDWQWTDTTRRRLRMKRETERTKAYMRRKRLPEGTWHCRLRLDKGTQGGGMLVLADPDVDAGFVCWLGGTYGNGALMLYRNGANALWASPQGKWHWDTDYVLEAEVADDKIMTRLLAADGKTLIAASPRIALTKGERTRAGMTGFHIWRGTGTFWDFSDRTRPNTVASGGTPPVAANPTSPKVFRLVTGTWKWIDPQGNALGDIGNMAPPAGEPALTCQGSGPHHLVIRSVHGAKGTFAGEVSTLEDNVSVSLLFQVSKESASGFECRLGKGCELRTLAGEVLWRDPTFVLAAHKRYRIEGLVFTDRIMTRVLDDKGKELLKSLDCYVPESNNERVGSIGFAATGPAIFHHWSFTK